MRKVEVYKKKIMNLTKNKKTIFVLSIPQHFKNKITNSLLIIDSGKVVHQVIKSHLPNYGVFDEKRYFLENKDKSNYFKFKNKKINFLICEDMWVDDYSKDLVKQKVDLIVIINASPFEIGKFKLRKKLASKRAKFYESSLIYLNLVGAQDDLIFDGGSFVMNSSGKIILQKEFFSDSDEIIDLNEAHQLKIIKKKSDNELLYKALMVGLENYMNKNNFKSAILGLSGGVDSALTLAIASDSLGKNHIKSFFLPSIFTSKESRIDALNLSRNLEINTTELSIENLKIKILDELKYIFKDLKNDITEENIQSRIRGLLLMAISNKFNSLLITTGNKSELSVGYSTLYGDMCGGYSLLKDIYKTKVFELCEWRNKNILDEFKVKKLNVIPREIIKKEPSAELKFDQKDSDSLPYYETLDKILELLIDQNRGIDFIVKKGFKKNIVNKIWDLVKKSEFKRYQSAIGPKVSGMSLSADRRFPLTNKFRL